MINYETFTVLITFFVLAPILGAFTLMFLFIFEKRIDLLENKNKKIALEKSLQQAIYNQLNQQIEPHFLFNTLNALLSLARLNRKEELVQSIESLSLYFKFKYQTTGPLISLQEELTYTEHYIAIQKLRFGSRLDVQIECEDDLMQVAIPPFVLQTLVENAFKHGLEKKIGPALLSILCSERQGSSVQLQVKDNGMQLDTTSTWKPAADGHGLDNIKQRLKLLYEDRAQLDMAFGGDKGSTVTVVWPKVYHQIRKDESG